MKEEKELKLAQIQKDVSNMVKTGSEITIKTAEDMSQATDFLGQIKARQKRIEELRLSFTKPMNEALRNINNEFKSASDPLEKIERAVKAVMTAYHNLEAEKIRKAQEKEAEKQRIAFQKEQDKKRKELEQSNLTKKAQKEAIKEVNQEEFVAKPTIEQEKTVKSDSGSSVTFKSVWKFRGVTNISIVPVEYLKVDEVAVNKAIRAGAREINGLDIIEEKEVSARR
jgi:hypothetical protein